MIPLSVPVLDGNVLKYVSSCIETNWVSTAGPFVEKFENDFKSYVKAPYAVSTNSGTAALHLSLLALGIGPGDEVIVPSMTFIASVNPIRYVGATPVFCDITKDTWVMDVSRIESLISKKTKAILPVHVYGNPVDMSHLIDIASRYRLKVIEDATESLGSQVGNQFTGTLGDIGCFSFNGNKTITTGAGGMIVTQNQELAQKLAYLSTQAKTVLGNGAFVHDDIGYNYRMPNILAALGAAQLESIGRIQSEKRRISQRYMQNLHHSDLMLPTERAGTHHAQWLFSICLKTDSSERRDSLIRSLAENGIQTRPFFQPIHLMKPYKCEKASADMENTLFASRFGINLPSTISLSDEEIDRICDLVLANISKSA